MDESWESGTRRCRQVQVRSRPMPGASVRTLMQSWLFGCERADGKACAPIQQSTHPFSRVSPGFREWFSPLWGTGSGCFRNPHGAGVRLGVTAVTFLKVPFDRTEGSCGLGWRGGSGSPPGRVQAKAVTGGPQHSREPGSLPMWQRPQCSLGI